MLCVVKDVVDPVADARLADFVVSSHMRAHPAVAERRAERAAAAEAAGEPMQVCGVLPRLLGLGLLLEARRCCIRLRASLNRVSTTLVRLPGLQSAALSVPHLRRMPMSLCKHGARLYRLQACLMTMWHGAPKLPTPRCGLLWHTRLHYGRSITSCLRKLPKIWSLHYSDEWLCWAQAEPPAHADPDILPQETLRKYITYAKQHCKPKLQNADYDKIAAVRFSALRASCMRRGALLNATQSHSSKGTWLGFRRAQCPLDKESCAVHA